MTRTGIFTLLLAGVMVAGCGGSTPADTGATQTAPAAGFGSTIRDERRALDGLVAQFDAAIAGYQQMTGEAGRDRVIDANGALRKQIDKMSAERPPAGADSSALSVAMTALAKASDDLSLTFEFAVFLYRLNQARPVPDLHVFSTELRLARQSMQTALDALDAATAAFP